MILMNVLLTDAQLAIAAFTAVTAFGSGITAMITAWKAWKQARRNHGAISDVHECVHEARAEVQALAELLRAQVSLLERAINKDREK